MSKRRRWIGRLLLALGSIALTLMATEIVVILLWTEPTADLDEAEVYPTDPRGYFDREAEGRYVLRTDRREHRCGEAPTADDIVFVGDSFAWGQGVRVEDTVSSLVRARGYPVRNCARPGNDLREIVTGIREASAQSARLVVYSLVLNDACGAEGEARLTHVEVPAGRGGATAIVDDGMWVRTGPREAYLEQRREALGAWSFLLTSVAFRWLHRRWALADLTERTTAVYQRCWQDSPLLQSSFDGLAAASREARGLLVVIWPLLVDLDDYPFADAHAVIKSSLERRGLRVLDLLDTFEGEDGEELTVHPLDRHPNEIAHARAADVIAEAIESSVGAP